MISLPNISPAEASWLEEMLRSLMENLRYEARAEAWLEEEARSSACQKVRDARAHHRAMMMLKTDYADALGRVLVILDAEEYARTHPWDQLCVCGHALGIHLAEPPYDCAAEDAHNMDRAAYPVPLEPCACAKFQPASRGVVRS